MLCACKCVCMCHVPCVSHNRHTEGTISSREKNAECLNNFAQTVRNIWEIAAIFKNILELSMTKTHWYRSACELHHPVHPLNWLSKISATQINNFGCVCNDHFTYLSVSTSSHTSVACIRCMCMCIMYMLHIHWEEIDLRRVLCLCDQWVSKF